LDSKATVQALMDSVQRGNFEKAKSLLSDDFQFSGPIPEPINGEAWLGMNETLKAACPDLDYHFHMEGADGDVVKVGTQLKGAHTRVLNLTNMNMGMIPATNKCFSNPHEHGTVTVKGDKVASWAVERTEGGDLMGILDQIGVKLPTT
jgi:hypothetical protein